MKFFADPTIRTFTSGRPSQNFDIVGMAFPRRFEFHINNHFSKRHALRQQRYKWTVYKDKNFKQQLGHEFDYENVITSGSWLRYKTKAIFPQETVYLKLTIINTETGLDMREYYFMFTKGYQKSLDGRVFVVDPVSKKRVVHDGALEEIQHVEHRKQGLGKYYTYEPKPSTIPYVTKSLTKSDAGIAHRGFQRVFDQIYVHYSEEPRVVFTITPPHLSAYAKIVLIMLNQMFNMQVADSYLTNTNQKPDYDTYNMLDEVGNLRSEGSGIPDLQVKESIGLGQGQYYTLILQTLQQLKDVYGVSDFTWCFL